MRAALIFTLLSAASYAQSQPANYEIAKVDDGLYHVYYDSSTAKSSVVEFEKFIVLLEVPIKNEGGGARNLKDYTYAGKRLLASLQQYFPKKPLKYVMHTHWHPHSLSSITPFVSNGITLVTTASNFRKIKEFADTVTLKKFRKQILIVETDSFAVKDKVNSIVAYRFLQKDFPNTPTPEYLYFYLPKYEALHTGCMYNRWRGEPIEGRELLTGREEDIHKFLLTKNLKPACFLRGSSDKDESKGMIPYSRFDHVIHYGISNAEINKKYFTLTDQELHSRKDSVVNVLRQSKIPGSFVNSMVYAALRKKEFQRALYFAQIQLALNPDDPNGWDTLGEVYYFMNELELARLHAKESKRISPDFQQGGELVWKADLAEYSKQWSSNR